MAATIVNFHFYTTMEANECFVASPVGVAAPNGMVGNAGYPKYPFHLEGKYSGAVQAGYGQRAPFVGEGWKSDG